MLLPHNACMTLGRWCLPRTDTKAASPEKLKHEAAVAALTAQIQLIELEASQRDPLF